MTTFEILLTLILILLTFKVIEVIWLMYCQWQFTETINGLKRDSQEVMDYLRETRKELDNQ